LGGRSQNRELSSPVWSKALADGGATDRAYILGFFLVLGLGALLIVVAWR
jgi:hypothetical protein